jgi:hypothetical protein
MSQFREVSESVRNQLREEGVVYTNNGNFLCPAEEDIMEEKVPETEIDPKLLRALAPDEKRTLSILLQSSMKIAADLYPQPVDNVAHKEERIRMIKKDAIDLALWVDRNSTGIMTSPFMLTKAAEVKK